MDLLLDVNVAVDICTKREPFFTLSRDSVAVCRANGGKIWLYAGSVQTLEYVVRAQLVDQHLSRGKPLSSSQSLYLARRLLQRFCRGKHWLAALAGECPVFESPDPEDEQLVRALGRFAPGAVKLLTRDRQLCERYPELTITPHQYLQTQFRPKGIEFVDLKTQQDATRPHLEQRVHRVLHHGQYIMGPEVRELEQKLAAYVGVKHAIGCSSGTDALLLPLLARGIGPGDAVFTTPFTFIATAEVISLLGATPVFVDIDPLTYNIDPKQLDKAIRAVKANAPTLHPLPTRNREPGTGNAPLPTGNREPGTGN
ncbi:MAG: DegT/DnrJ/EryC1/StrS family aminotransferase, partial [Thermodesulfobacteriota bacterium]